MISDIDRRFDPPQRRVLVTDFGIGSSINGLTPRNDLESLAAVMTECLEILDPADLSPEDQYVYRNLSNSFRRRLDEIDPTVPLFADPADLRELIEDVRIRAKKALQPSSPPTLADPFDYLSCEQMGDTPQLLTRLFSKEFLAYPDLVSKSNIIFTGPRGCGKTTVFRNLSLRDQVIAGQVGPRNLGEFLGIYYQAGADLRYAFPYDDEDNENFRKVTVHYFNVAIAAQIFDVTGALRGARQELHTSTSEWRDSAVRN